MLKGDSGGSDSERETHSCAGVAALGTASWCDGGGDDDGGGDGGDDGDGDGGNGEGEGDYDCNNYGQREFPGKHEAQRSP